MKIYEYNLKNITAKVTVFLDNYREYIKKIIKELM
jgi:hypothetical protein